MWPSEPSEHGLDHGEADEGDDGAGKTFQVAHETAFAADLKWTLELGPVD